MKNIAFLLLLSLAACSRQSASPAAEAPAATGSVVGTWQLTRLETSRTGSALPSQHLTLTADQKFQFYQDGKLLAEGTYTLGTGSACGGGTGADPLLSVSITTPNAYAPAGNYTLANNTLVIDQCLAADGPRYTFERQR